MSFRGFVRRRWVPIAVAVAAAAAFYPLKNYLVDFRKPDVPLVVTPHDVVAGMLDAAEVGPDDVVYDLGSGDGRVVVAAARRGAKRVVGVEIDPDLVAVSREAIRAAGAADRATVVRGDLFKQDLRPATVVTMFLKPDLLERLRPKLNRLAPGTRLVSHMYRIPQVKAKLTREVPSAETKVPHKFYVYVTPLEDDAPTPPPATKP